MLYYCATSILAFLYYGQTVVPKYFNELAEKQKWCGLCICSTIYVQLCKGNSLLIYCIH